MKYKLVSFEEIRAFSSNSKYYLKNKYKYEKGTILLSTDYQTRVGLVAWKVGGSQQAGRIYKGIAPTVTILGIKVLEME